MTAAFTQASRTHIAAMPKPPRKASRSKAGKPELKPLGEHLAALLNPALTSGPPIGFAEAPATPRRAAQAASRRRRRR